MLDDQPRMAFVDTPTSRELRGGVEWVVSRFLCGLIVGPPGIGKTVTLQRIAAEHETRAKLFVASPATSTVRASLIAIAELFGVDWSRRKAAEVESNL